MKTFTFKQARNQKITALGEVECVGSFQPAIKHTPGPWHLNTLEVVPFSIHANRGCVAEVSKGTLNEVGTGEIEANARLIAAAPELLDAAHAAYEELNDLAENGLEVAKPGKVEVYIDLATLISLRDVLAKIKGAQ